MDEFMDDDVLGEWSGKVDEFNIERETAGGRHGRPFRGHGAEMDLGGVDVAGARRVPAPGEPMYGLYEHKRSFGAEWLELAGAHERVLRPRRYRAGRVAARVRRLLPRLGGRQ